MRPRLVWCLLSIRCWEGLLFLPMGVVGCSLGGSRCSLILGSLIMWSGVSCCCLVARSWSWRCVLGARLSAGWVQELVQEAPLVLGEQGGVRLQVVVGEPEQESGRRSFEIYSRPDSPGEDGGSWTRHAGGVLVRGEPARERVEESWPPVGSESVDIDGLYDALEEQGLEYGPAFQGLRVVAVLVGTSCSA